MALINGSFLNDDVHRTLSNIAANCTCSTCMPRGLDSRPEIESNIGKLFAKELFGKLEFGKLEPKESANKMASNEKYYRPSAPMFAMDEAPFLVGQVISTTNRISGNGDAILITAVTPNPEKDDDGNPIGGMLYAGFRSFSGGERVATVIAVVPGTAVTVWTEYLVQKTPKDVKALYFPVVDINPVPVSDEV